MTEYLLYRNLCLPGFPHQINACGIVSQRNQFTQTNTVSKLQEIKNILYKFINAWEKIDNFIYDILKSETKLHLPRPLKNKIINKQERFYLII